MRTDHQDVDHKALERERRRLTREKNRRMRGRRSVFEIVKAMKKRAKKGSR